MPITEIQDRRTFLKQTAALGMGSILGTFLNHPEVKAARRFRPASTELIKIGIVCCEEGSSHIWDCWGPQINPIGEFTRLSGMLMTHCWDVHKPTAEKFAARYGVPNVVDRYDDMIGKVDAVIISSLKGAAWFDKLAAPYLKAKVPAYVNRPFSYSMKKAERITELADENNTPIICSSSHEFLKETAILSKKAQELTPLSGVLALNEAGGMIEYPWHGIHGIYFLHAILGGDVRQISVAAPDAKNLSYHVTMQYNAQPGGNPFFASLQQLPGPGVHAWARIYGKEITMFEQHSYQEGNRWDTWIYFFLPTVLAIQRIFDSGEMLQTYEQILEKTKIFLAGYYSYLEYNGDPVLMEDFPRNWEAPNPYPEHIPEGYFE